MFRQAPSFPYHDLGIVEDGNTASRAISKDAYVIWKGESYFASTDILQGATLEENVNLTAIPDGVINGVVSALNNNITSYAVLGTLASAGTAELSESIRNFAFIYVDSRPGGYHSTRYIILPVALFITTCSGESNAMNVTGWNGDTKTGSNTRVWYVDDTHIVVRDKCTIYGLVRINGNS